MTTVKLEQYTDQLLALLPIGAAWDRNSPGLRGLMTGLAEELVRIDERAADLLAESQPGGISETLDQWEKDFGLPDISRSAQTFAERKGLVIQRFQMYGSQSREFLVSMCEALGVTATISEYQERRFGDDVGGLYYGQQYSFVIQFNIEFPAGMSDSESDALKALIESTLTRIVHAHKYCIFNYELPDAALTDTGFAITDNGFYLVDTGGSLLSGE